MSYQLTIIPKPSYLHAVVTGQNTAENVSAYLDELLRECVTRKCYRILIEERLEGPRLKLVDVFHLVLQGSPKVRGVLKTIAYVDVNAEGDLMKLAQDAANARGVPMKLFPTVAEAEEWIKKEPFDPGHV